MSSCNGDSADPDQGSTTDIDPLPQIEILLLGEDIVDEPKVPAEMIVREGEEVLYDGRVGIEFRGATSQILFPKKSYGVETWDENNEDIDVSILGMPEEEDWILYGPYSDKTLLRNRLIYQLARDMDRYASRTRMVELSIDGQDQGLYIWMEKLKRDNDRIDINRLRPDEDSGEDLTGGYILKIDKTVGNTLEEGYTARNSFTSAYDPPLALGDQRIRFLYEYPDADEITSEQRAYISEYVSAFEDVLASDDFADPATGYRLYIDVGSFIDFFILNELSNNTDAYRISTFLHKDKGGKLTMGPIWDFNIAFGNSNYCGGDGTEVWTYRFNERCSGDFWLVPFWWDRLLKDPTFVDELQARWQDLRSGVLADASILAHIDRDVDRLIAGGAVEANDAIWSIIGQGVWPNFFVGDTYQAEVDYLKQWIVQRTSWMDQAIQDL